MPIKYLADHICEKCNKKFEWAHFDVTRKKIADNGYVVEVVPNIQKAYSINQNVKGDYDVRVNCPYCGYDNSFVVNQTDYNNYLK